MTSTRAPVTQRAREGYDRGIDLLERAVPLARGVQRLLVAYASVVALSGLVVVLVVLVDDPPGVWYTWAGWLALVGLMAVAPSILFFFARMIREVLELPAKLRALPDVGPAHAQELGALLREAHAQGTTIRLRTLPRDLWRLTRMMLALHDDVPTAGVLLALARVPLLIAVGLSLVFGLAQIMLAPTVVLFVVVGRAF
jgi:hypothetical protein